jgi:t-SNARE complex subunit (syntaxin)
MGEKFMVSSIKGEVHAVMCFAYTNEIPKSVDELEKLSTDAFLQSAMRDQSGGQIAIAYTVWSKKKGGGKLIVKEVFKKIKKSNHLNRLVTLSPLTEMATNFHEKNGAKLIQINETTQNFEYKVL